MAPRTRGFAHRIDIACTPAEVWSVLCGPKLLPLWAGPDAQINPQQGGSWSITMAGITRDAMIDVFDPPRRLRLIYLPPADADEFGAVVDDFLLDSEGEGTIVRLLCSGVPETPYWSAYHMKARAIAERSLARLKALTEQRERVLAQKSAGAT